MEKPLILPARPARRPREGMRPYTRHKPLAPDRPSNGWPELWRILEKRKITLSELARMTGIPKGSLTSCAAGHSHPSGAVYRTVADVLSVPVSSLIVRRPLGRAIRQARARKQEEA